MFKKVALGVAGLVSIAWGSASVVAGLSALKKDTDKKN